MIVTEQTIEHIDKLGAGIAKTFAYEDVEDIKQDVMVMILEREGNEAPDTALITTMFNRRVGTIARDERRRQELLDEQPDALVRFVGDDDTADPLEYLEAEELVRVFEGMTPLLRQIVQGLYIDNKSVPALAKELDMAPNALYQNVNRIKQILKENGYGG